MAKYKVLTSFFVGQNKELPEKNIPPSPPKEIKNNINQINIVHSQ